MGKEMRDVIKGVVRDHRLVMISKGLTLIAK